MLQGPFNRSHCKTEIGRQESQCITAGNIKTVTNIKEMRSFLESNMSILAKEEKVLFFHRQAAVIILIQHNKARI